VSEVQDTVSSTLTDLSSVTADVTDETLLNDLNDLGESITDLGDMISSGGLLGAAAGPGPGRSKRETDCARLHLQNSLLTKIDAILDKIGHIETESAPGNVEMFISKTIFRFSSIRKHHAPLFEIKC